MCSSRFRNIDRAERATIQTTSALILLYVLSTSWNLVINILRSADHDRFGYLSKDWQYYGAECLALIDNAVNPFVYVLRYDAFRECLVTMFARHKERENLKDPSERSPSLSLTVV